MKRICITLCLILTAICQLTAGVVKIDGVYYSLDENNLAASVTFKPFEDDPDGWMYHPKDSLYVGDVVIPSQVSHNGETYSVNAIGDNAFAGSSQMTTLQIPESVMTFGTSAFSLCSSLSAITIDESNPQFRSIDGIIYYKNKMELYFAPRAISGHLTLPDGLTEIPSSAFQRCQLDAVTIPNSVETIKDGAFNNCPNLSEVNFGSGLRVIQRDAFSQCPFLQIIDFSSTQLTDIGLAAFMDCEDLAIVYLSDCLKTIGMNAFRDCNLIGISLPATLESIGESAFLGCEGLTTVINNSPLNIKAGSEDNGCVGLYLTEEISGNRNIKEADIYLTCENRTLSIFNAKGKTVTVYDITGQIIFQADCALDILKLNLKSSGLYIVNIGSTSWKIPVK